jgi:hypothetical protein
MLVFLMLLGMIESKGKSRSFFFNLILNFRQAWISLGDMSKEKAMEEYIRLLLNRYSTFRIFLQNQHVENEEKDRLR